MGKTLVVAEKPSVGRDIARVLGCKQKGDGCLIGDQYIVTWAIGHLITLAEPQDYDPKYKRWAFDTLPILPEKMKLKTIRSTKKQYDVIKNWMKDSQVDSIICATDSGREGELIFRYIYTYAGCRKPFKRLWISSMTDVAIKEGFASLRPGEEYDYLYQSARCRSEADWLVGMNASRGFTIRYKALLSVGRVQTPTLAILVGRQKEIDAFIPQPYWEVKAYFQGFNGIWIDLKTNETRIMDEARAEELAAKVKEKRGSVTEVENEEKRQLPPLLYDLTELQRDGNRKFGFSAKKTLSIAQALYEKRKLITYPRTDSRHLSQDMIPKIKATLEKLNQGDYKPYVEYVLGLEKLPINKRIVDNSKVTDHHAIIPTDVRPKLESLTRDESRIYDLIVKRFLSVFYPPYTFINTRVISQVEGESFLSKGKTILQLGWMEIYRDESGKNDGEEQELPRLKVGDGVEVEEAEVMKKQTKPPNAYNEATLLSAMQNAGRFVEDEELKEQLKENGLGTPATRAAVIERLLEVGYIQRKGKTLVPTPKGMSLIEIVPEELKSPETTGKWEKGLSLISKGKMEPQRFMESIERYVKYIIQQSMEQKLNVTFPEEKKRPYTSRTRTPLGKCPSCQEGMIIPNSKGYGCTQWKKGCKFFIGEICSKKLTHTQVTKLLKSQETDLIKGFKSNDGKSFDASLVLRDGKIVFK